MTQHPDTVADASGGERGPRLVVPRVRRGLYARAVTTALYRRYRPDTFAEVIGQEHVTEPLMQALRSDRVNHAYLFSGPRGCGKTTSARILARCLNCAQGPTPTPCGVCDSCVELGRGGPGSLDVVEIDAASHGGVDDARDLRERATFAPARDRYKIFILDEAHMVSPQGFNALLKIVEEPPEHVKFIFATTEPDKVIGTIRSRTHHYPFRLVGPATLQPYLEQMCAAEGVAVGAGVLPLVVRSGGGSVRDSLSVLDQLVAGADAAGIDYERAVALLGYTHSTLLDDVVEAVAARDGASAFRVVDRVVSSGHDPRRFVEDLLERWRDLIVIAASGPSAQAVLRDLPDDQLERMRAQATALGATELSRSADLVNLALTEMTGATSPRRHLERLVARLLLPAADDGAVGLAARLDRVERELGPGRAAAASGARSADPAAPSRALPAAVPPASAPAAVPPAGAPPGVPLAAAPPAVGAPPAVPARDTDASPEPHQGPTPAAGPAPVAATAARPADRDASDGRAAAEPTPEGGNPSSDRADAEAGGPAPAVATAPRPAQPVAPVIAGLDAELVRRRWPEVLQTLKGLRMATWVLVDQNAQVAEVTADKVTLGFTTPQLATTFRTGPHAQNVQRALHETLGLDIRVETTLTGPATEGGGEVGGVQSRRFDSAADEGQTRASGSTPRSAGPADARASAAQTRLVSTSDAEASWSSPARPPTGGGAPGRSGPPRASTGEATGRDQGRETGGDHGGDPTPGPHEQVPDGPEPMDEGPSRAPVRRPELRTPVRQGAPNTAGRRPGARPADDGADTDPSDPELAPSGLVGAPLIAQMLGGTVIDEIPDDTV